MTYLVIERVSSVLHNRNIYTDKVCFVYSLSEKKNKMRKKRERGGTSKREREKKM